ncbi:hypothetical protein T02_7024 [Trichinella nativa]|uniref:Saposin B-type domain-containing protein n=1 Tax=Trichinella nativa TaxID=6335 RepID=A0A0V1KR20_9BILA|nr:hypothetical protein T02_7024 [Trichinella nativa]
MNVLPNDPRSKLSENHGLQSTHDSVETLFLQARSDLIILKVWFSHVVLNASFREGPEGEEKRIIRIVWIDRSTKRRHRCLQLNILSKLLSLDMHFNIVAVILFVCISATNGIVITEEKADPDWYRTKKLMLETNSIPKIGRPLDNKIIDGITVEMLPDELSWKLPPVSHGNNHTCELCKSYIMELRDIINDPEKLCEAAVEGLDLILENMKESLIIRNPFKSVDVLCDECLFLTNEAASILSDEEYQCETAIDNYAPTLFQDLLDYLSNPKPVCQKIGFCGAANEIERTPLFPYGAVLNTEDALTNEVIEMCNHFSSDWRAQCADFMQIYFKSILNNFNPTEACDRLHLCTISERRELMKMTPNQRRRLTCESCELMADNIMDDIEELELEEQLSTELIRGCESMSFIKKHESINWHAVGDWLMPLMNRKKERERPFA